MVENNQAVYLWVRPESSRNKDMGVYDDENSPNRFLLYKERPLESGEFSITPIVHFDVPKVRLLQLDCIPNNTLVPLVNHRIRAILQEVAPNQVEFFEARLIFPDGELEGYSFLHPTTGIHGVNHERSRVHWSSGVIVCIDYLEFQPGCMRDLLITRDKEEGSLIVSEELRTIFKREKIKGVRFVLPEDYYGPLRVI